MHQKDKIQQSLAGLDPDLQAEILDNSAVRDFPRDTEILREEQYVKVIPLVVEGLIKVFTRHDERELLLYYIRPQESCVMSFAAALKNTPSQVFAITEEPTTALLLPVDNVLNWTRQFTDLNNLFFQQYNLRYGELLDTIHHVLFDKLDKRLYKYLKERVELTGQNPIKISHRQIAQELGTAREVISRTAKKLESEMLIRQHSQSIEILPW